MNESGGVVVYILMCAFVTVLAAFIGAIVFSL